MRSGLRKKCVKKIKKPIEITRAIVGTIALSKMKNNSVLTIVRAKKEQGATFVLLCGFLS